MFKPVDTAIKFAENEARILAFWKEHKIFEKSLQQREPVKDSRCWVFYEGPPTANGRPHPGHVLTRVVKDLFPRYKTMCGYYVPRKAGWDTHGLPVEIEVEKELKLDGKTEVLKYGVEPFVRKCMDSVFKYTTDWEQLTEKIGFWIDLKDAYVTYHKEYVESVWWSLKELFQQNLLYRGHKILPWCPHCQTGLSAAEVGLGYETVEDPSCFVTFRDVNWDQNKTSFVAWTTTPWTLPSNAGLAVKADTEYSYVKVGEETLIMASALVKQVMGKIPHEVVKTEMGSALVGRKYSPLFGFLRPQAGSNALFLRIDRGGNFMFTYPPNGKVWEVCAANFVTLDTGSGIVHMAPAYGADDYALGQKEGLPVIQLVGPDGKFVEGCGPFTGRFCKEADADLLKDLKQRGLLLKRENYKHEYPFCWRCKNPLIYFARGGWFIRTTREIDRVIENNQKVDWHPEHIKDGRFGSFLKGNVDWALSRERYWGTPLPIWHCEETGEEEAIGSFDELKTKPGVTNLDFFDKAKAREPGLNDHLRVHKPWIDEITYTSPKGGKMVRVSEVIDCWYDSGAMPYAQWGYPHAEGSKEKFNRAFPADFISEAIDQTRGWFYSLIAEATLLRESFEKTSGCKRGYPVPYKTCLVLGHIGDEFGKKISKSNPEHKTPKYDPNAILNEEGADALRWFFYSSNPPWNNSRFSRPAVREAQKDFIIKLRNVYSFFVIYANIDGFNPADVEDSSTGKTELDRWILSELAQSTRSLRRTLNAYNIFDAAQVLNGFVDSLSNWYVRRSRDRFWSNWHSPERRDAHDLQKLSAYRTLYYCLTELSKLIAPFVPFLAEEIYQNLCVSIPRLELPESVHLCNYPEPQFQDMDGKLSEEINLVREVASVGRRARAASKLKTRQPLQSVTVITTVGWETAATFDPTKPVLPGEATQNVILKHVEVLKEELNVKEIKIVQDLSDEDRVKCELRPNFKAIGAKFRDLVPLIKQCLFEVSPADVERELTLNGKYPLQLSNGKVAELSRDDIEITLKAKEGYAAASGKSVVVVLDTHLTPDLLDEGIAREIVNRINGWRSEMKLAYEQRIKLALSCGEKIDQVARKFADYIAKETLSTEVKTGSIPTGWTQLEEVIDDQKVVLGMQLA